MNKSFCGFIALSLTMTAWAAQAAPPPNDLLSAAKLVSVGFSESLDTSEATTDSDDAYFNLGGCNFPATDASVWYQFVGTGERFKFEVFNSDYSASLIIAPINQSSFFACGTGGGDFSTEPGVTYNVLVFDDQRDGGGNGGTLNISISLAPPPPALQMTLDRFGTLDPRTGAATISGTYKCVNPSAPTVTVPITITINAWQQAGRNRAAGFAEVQDEATGDGTVHTWSATILPDPASPKFVGGKAMTLDFAYSFGPNGVFDSGFLEQTVILRAKH